MADTGASNKRLFSEQDAAEDSVLVQNRKWIRIEEEQDHVVDKVRETKQGNSVFKCTVPGCLASRSTLHAMDAHLRNAHVVRCLEQAASSKSMKCKKVVFPTKHLAEIHAAEAHSPLLWARKARGDPVFQCFDSQCAKSFASHAERQEHIIHVHKWSVEIYNLILHKIECGMPKNITTQQTDDPMLELVEGLKNASIEDVRFGANSSRSFRTNRCAAEDRSEP